MGSIKYEKGTVPVDNHPGRIGCSQIAGALGVSEWKNASVDVLKHFRGEEVSFDDEALQRMEVGSLFEEPIAKLVAKRQGFTVRNDKLAHWRKDLPELICHPDRIIAGGFRDVKKVALEIKTASAYARNWGEDWSDDIPTQYLLQCIGYCICGVAEAVLLASERNHELHYYWIHPSKETIEAVAEAVRQWVQQAKDPDFVPMPKTYEEVRSAYPFLIRDDVKEADLELYAKVVERNDLKKQIGDMEAKVDILNGEILMAMEGYKTLTFGGQKVATLVSSKGRKTFDREQAVKDFPELNDNKYWKDGKPSVYLR